VPLPTRAWRARLCGRLKGAVFECVRYGNAPSALLHATIAATSKPSPIAGEPPPAQGPPPHLSGSPHASLRGASPGSLRPSGIVRLPRPRHYQAVALWPLCGAPTWLACCGYRVAASRPVAFMPPVGEAPRRRTCQQSHDLLTCKSETVAVWQCCSAAVFCTSFFDGRIP
jgi:hypothetical protein